MIIDAANLQHRQLNIEIRNAIRDGILELTLQNVNGQRYIAAGVNVPVSIKIEGVPGNDLGAFMDGPTIRVSGNGQDCIGNTMSSGTIVVDGDARDLAAHSMRGGRIFVKGDLGYRAGVHMKSYGKQVPIVVAGGVAGDFTGEYMAGGMIVILNLNGCGVPSVGNLVATGMHGGSIYIRGVPDEHTMGREAKAIELDDDDVLLLRDLVSDFAGYFPDAGVNFQPDEYRKLLPLSHRPYGRLYAY